MRILIVVDTMNSAITKLAKMVQKYNEHLLIDIFPFHPKKYTEEDLEKYKALAEKADLIDFEYWKTALVLVKKFPCFKDKKKILTHHNPYSLLEDKWEDFDVLVAKNKTQQKVLRDSVYIPHAVDLDWHKFNPDYTKEKVVGMVANRIESKKGIKEVAQVCKELGYTFLLIGRISNMDYFQEVIKINPDTDFQESVSDDELKSLYKEMMVLVCNSIDNFESGTMPILEAMATGVPVLTRKVGLVPDIGTDDNMVVRTGDSTDVEDLKNELMALVENEERRLKMRKDAWNTVRHFSDIKMAKLYAKLYDEMLFEKPLVSIIMSTYNRKEQVIEILKSLEDQTYKHIEAIVADDDSDDETREAVKLLREEVSYPIKYINTHKEGYNLAMARNMALTESEGKIIMFCGSRLKPDKEAVEKFASALSNDNLIWYFGDKGSQKKTFTEGFSAVKRSDLINGGMFNERIDAYGGMTQDISTRFNRLGFELKYLPEAKAEELISTRSSNRRDEIWKMKFLLWKI